MLIRTTLLAATLFATASLTQAAEMPIGKHQLVSEMEIGAVYLQPIKMEPAGMMRDTTKSDIHLEADIHATKGNKNGFAEGDWVPDLIVKYELEKVGGPKISGDMMPMVASDGPHYGDNVKLAGPGKYKLKLSVFPQSFNKGAMFGRHTDKETGVGPWFKPFDLNYEFAYAGTGKKGGY
ncbi:MAG: iron transporter [Formivibrio sp.]|nr:iron transporter [Formivibrio sp.]